jgi:hypothetical protein
VDGRPFLSEAVLTEDGSHQYVCIEPFPLAITCSERAVNQCLLTTIYKSAQVNVSPQFS